MSQENKKQNPNKRFIGKVKNENGTYGVFQKILVDNPFSVNKDGTPNTYHKGVLLWCDNETGKKYLLKQISLGNYKEPKNNCTSYLAIDLGSEYEVQELG